MYGANDKPDSGGVINGLNAIEFDGIKNSGPWEGMYARKTLLRNGVLPLKMARLENP